MLIVFISHAKIIHDQGEIDGTPHVPPVTGGMADFIIPVLGESTFQYFVGQHTGLQQPIQSLWYIDVYCAIAADFAFSYILSNDFVWDVGERNFHVLRALYWCIKVKVFDIETAIFSFCL